MNKSRKLLTSVTICLLLSGYNYAKENVTKGHSKTTHTVMSSGCVQDLGAAYLQINNIRARIMDEGDMWWDPGAGLPRYYAPANSNTCAQFAAALWVGGYDAGNQLKVAAMTYRQNGEDFWAGPIDTTKGSITPEDCKFWDRMFYVTRAEVETFHINYPHGTLPQNIPSDILNWPGSGASYGVNKGYESNSLAPFVDVGGTGIYDPTLGDYPAFDLTGTGYCQNELYGDACLWWVINDVGNIHSESGGVPIGLEVREQAFAFQTNDAINNMTFYHYQVINRSTFGLFKTYFGFWDDFDLGNGGDNLVGCDVGRNMGYGYDGHVTNIDGSGQFAGEYGYHNDPAAVGDVFFQGPKADKGDTNHYVKNGFIGMARFVYYNNDFTIQGNPTNQTSYYKYLTGLWQDGTPMTYGGNGYGGSLPCNYMFPWTPGGACTTGAVNTDPTGYGTGGVPQAAEWDEVSAADVSGDRRLLQSAGPFTLQPGAVNYVIVGCVWDQPATNGNGNIAPICLIQQDADLAQGLFNNCFKVVNGPDAPDVAIQELNDELILTLSNSPNSNNYKEHYAEKSPTILPPFTDIDYVFQGYEIYQLIDSSVTASELLNDNTKARLVAQCDVQDNVSQIINYVFNSGLNAVVPTLEVSGANKGIVHSFDIKTDAFSEDNQSTLVNDRPYYYMVIAYAYNNYFPYNPAGPDTNLRWGQKLPFLQGRRNIKVYTAYPHIVSAQSYGTIQNSNYGDGVAITRLEGHGNGFNTIELDQASIDHIVQYDTMAHPTYLPGQGPISVKVVDPLNVVNANFIVKFIPGAKSKLLANANDAVTDSATRWELINLNTRDTVYSDTTINYQYEQVFPQYGISISIVNVKFPGGANQQALDSSCSVSFSDPHLNWLSAIATSVPGVSLAYWLRSGQHTPPPNPPEPDAAFSSYGPPAGGNYDPEQYYNQILKGTWGPYTLCAVSDQGLFCDNGPAFSIVVGAGSAQNNSGVHDSIGNIASVDIVFTADRSKWSRCVVFEEEDAPLLAQGGAGKMDIRKYYSIDQSGQFSTTLTDTSSNPGDANYISPTGMGWFPGYAINIETGERLNVAYGEDSWLNGHGGRDMKWDPDSIVYSTGGSSGAGSYFGYTSIFGGKHYIYVFGHNHHTLGGYSYGTPAYDGDQFIVRNYYNQKPVASKTWWKERILDNVMWVNIPILNRGHQLLESDATIRLRVAKPYDTAYGESFLNSGTQLNQIQGSNWRSTTPVNNNYPMYSFSTNGLQVATNSSDAAKSALALINVVPNPYYAYNQYETNRLDTRVRITNLPPTCTISIFTISGTLIKVINKNNPDTFIDWNLQNQFNVPIASGLYLIHVAVPNVGEVTLKWFGVMRPLDLTSY